ncbi:MAG: FAD-dependent monooxygenase [Cystobacterineae bacterium]|nr:FAD-dependent monooxygenase [Cystobacterineae bacterium]
MPNLDIAIVGGAFTGLSAAAALAAQGLKVAVFDSLPGPNPQYRGELIHPRGVRGLSKWGLLEPLRKAGSLDLTGFAVTPEEDGSEAVLLDYPTWGGPGLGIEQHAIVSTMRAEVGTRPNVELHLGKRVEGLLRENGRVVGLYLEGGEEVRASLTIGADGRQSHMRQWLGVPHKIKLLSYSVILTVTEDALPYGRRGHVFLGAPGTILAYPYGENLVRLCIDVSVDAPKGPSAWRSLLLNDYVPKMHEPLRTAVEKVLNDESLPIVAAGTHSIRTEACVVPGALLAGDAAGCAHPLTAGGMLNAVNDVLIFSECLAKEGPSDEALKNFQRARYRFIRSREMFTDALYEVFSSKAEGARGLRKGIVRYWLESERARSASMRILAGDETSPTAFLSEYTRVMGLSTLSILRSENDKLTERALRLSALLQTSLGRLERAAEITIGQIYADQKTRLSALPPLKGE